ncbi:MAG: hypothetical protein M3R41_07260 [Pseudomonadota bacterium]|nr:hypothetical protein [Pseudomonadota bacterium]
MNDKTGASADATFDATETGDLAGPDLMETLRRRWPMVLGGIVTAVMVAMLARQLLSSGLTGLDRSLPDNPLFYATFVVFYISPVIGDYAIFRMLWGIPIAGFAALINKRVASDMINYAGEAYFYAWGRQNARGITAPFAAVKDVSILSAQAGNAFTLLLLAFALPLGIRLLDTHQVHVVLVAAIVTLGTSLPFVIFSKRVFSLPRATLWKVFGIHCTRVVMGSVLAAIMWHFGLPAVSLALWLLLAAARLLVSRLPLIPNKDLVFATIANLLIGQHAALSQMLAVVAALTLSTHFVLVMLIALGNGAARVRRRRTAA